MVGPESDGADVCVVLVSRNGCSTSAGTNSSFANSSELLSTDWPGPRARASSYPCLPHVMQQQMLVWWMRWNHRLCQPFHLDLLARVGIAKSVDLMS